MLTGDYSKNTRRMFKTKLIFDSENNMNIINKALNYTGKAGESLTSFIELDLSGLEGIIIELYESLYGRCNEINPPQELCDFAFSKYNAIAQIHPYFYNHFEDKSLVNVNNPDLNHNIINYIFALTAYYHPKCYFGLEYINRYQNEYREIIDYCLNLDVTKENPQKRLFQYILEHNKHIPRIEVEYDITKQGINEVYFFDAIDDACFLELLHCVKAGIKYRQCKLCKRYFDVTSYPNTRYCDRIMPGKTRACKEIGRDLIYKESLGTIDHKYELRLARKRKYNRIEALTLDQCDYLVWDDKVRGWLDLIKRDSSRINEYIEWLKSDKIR